MRIITEKREEELNGQVVELVIDVHAKMEHIPEERGNHTLELTQALIESNIWKSPFELALAAQMMRSMLEGITRDKKAQLAFATLVASRKWKGVKNES